MKSDLEIAHETAKDILFFNEEDGYYIDKKEFRQALADRLEPLYFSEDIDIYSEPTYQAMIKELTDRTDTIEIINERYESDAYKKNPGKYLGAFW